MKRYDYHINEYGERVQVPKDLKKLLNLQYLRLTNKTYSVGRHDLPELKSDTEVFPDFIALYNHPADYHKTPNTAVAFYLYDDTFDGIEGLYNAIYYKNVRLLNKFKERFKGVKFFIAPDYSQLGDLDDIENHYRIKKARVVALWLTMELGAIVIPNITYPTIDSLWFYLNGLESCTVVAFSTMGYVDDEVERNFLIEAVKQTVDKLSLNTIIFKCRVRNKRTSIIINQEVNGLIHGLSEEEKLKVIRPLLGDHTLDQFSMPVIHRTLENQIDFENMIPVGIQNLTTKVNNSKKLVLPFNYDKILLKYWNDPMKYIPRFQSVMAIGTPDYSVYPGMNINEIRHNIYMSRWLGCLWQSYQCTVLPVISWWEEETYDICFSGIEKGSIVIISTLGCRENQEIFLSGFEEMKRRIAPPLIIVYGNMLDGMTGRFINIKYTEAFYKKKEKYKQLSLFKESIIFERRDVVQYGR